MKKYLLILVIFISSTNLFAGEFYLGVYPGYGFYTDFSTNKNTLNMVSKQIDYLRVTDEFPDNFNFSMILYNNTGKLINFGFTYSFNSTGGRAVYSDYSGMHSFDIISDCHTLGIILTFNSKHSGFLKLQPYAGIGLYSSEISLIEEIILVGLGKDRMVEVIDGTGFYFEPGLRVIAPFEYFNIGLSASYFMEITGEYDYGYEHSWNSFHLAFTSEINLTKLIKSLSGGEDN